MNHGRLPWPTPAELTTEARELYEKIAGGPRASGTQAFPLTDPDGRLNGPFNAMLVSPAIGTALQELGAAIRYRNTLPDRAREIAILEVSVVRACEFEWYAHERVGRASGLTADEIAAMLRGVSVPTFDEREATVRHVVHDCLLERMLDEQAFVSAQEILGTRMLMDCITLAGYYDLLSLTLTVWQTPLPDGAKPVFTNETQG